jgi:hypothetical protein
MRLGMGAGMWARQAIAPRMNTVPEPSVAAAAELVAAVDARANEI